MRDSQGLVRRVASSILFFLTLLFLFKGRILRLDVSSGVLSVHFGELFGAQRSYDRSPASAPTPAIHSNENRPHSNEAGEDGGIDDEAITAAPSPKPTTYSFHPNFGKPTFKPTKTDDDVAVTPTLDNDDTAMSVTVMFGGSRFRSSQWWSEAPTSQGDPIPYEGPDISSSEHSKVSTMATKPNKKTTDQHTSARKKTKSLSQAQGKDKGRSGITSLKDDNRNENEARTIAEKIVARKEAKKQRLEAATVEKITEKISARMEARRRKESNNEENSTPMTPKTLERNKKKVKNVSQRAGSESHDPKKDDEEESNIVSNRKSKKKMKKSSKKKESHSN